MIERIAKAIEDKHPSVFGFHDTARAVLAAMREPTETMVNSITDSPSMRLVASGAWQALIDAALAEDGKAADKSETIPGRYGGKLTRRGPGLYSVEFAPGVNHDTFVIGDQD